MKDTIEIKVNKDLGFYKPGETVHIPINKWGKPTERFWRNRIRDSAIDNCITVVKPSEPKKKTNKSKTTNSK